MGSGIYKKSLIICLSIVIFLSLISPVLAVPFLPIVQCGLKTGPPEFRKDCTSCDLIKVAKNVIDFVLAVIVPSVGTILIIYGGVVLLTSAGSEEKVKKGRTIIENTVIGVFIALSSWLIVNSVLRALAKENIAREWWKIDCRVEEVISRLQVRAEARPNPARVGENVTFTVNVAGGTAPYHCIWRGSVEGEGCVKTKAFERTGTYVAIVSMTDSARPANVWGPNPVEVRVQEEVPPPPPPEANACLLCRAFVGRNVTCGGRTPACNLSYVKTNLPVNDPARTCDFASEPMAQRLARLRTSSQNWLLTEGFPPTVNHLDPAHCDGNAIDIKRINPDVPLEPRAITARHLEALDQLCRFARQSGLRITNEYTQIPTALYSEIINCPRPRGFSTTTGPHLHLEVP